MLSLQAIELASELRDIPREQIVIIGSMALALHKDLFGIPADQYHIHVDDLDLSIPRLRFEALNGTAADKATELLPEGWLRNGYHGVHTVRRSIVVPPSLDVTVPELKRPVQLDVGTGAHTWSHDELLARSFGYQGYRLITPQRQLIWYEALNRKKDIPKIELLRMAIIPALDKLIERDGTE